MGIWTGASWLSIDTSGGLLWTRQWTCLFHTEATETSLTDRPLNLPRAVPFPPPLHLRIFFSGLTILFARNIGDDSHFITVPTLWVGLQRPRGGGGGSPKGHHLRRRWDFFQWPQYNRMAVSFPIGLWSVSSVSDADTQMSAAPNVTLHLAGGSEALTAQTVCFLPLSWD
jgi:hypothetical protein